MKPVIGITTELKAFDPPKGDQLQFFANYAECIDRAGGIPIVLPPTGDPAEIWLLLDGWLIPGGEDIDACHFGETNHEKARLGHPRRLLFESKLFQAMPPELPVFGICYGMQFLNVMRKGSLEQHIPDRLHHNEHAGGPLQNYRLTGISRLASILGRDSANGRSYHHQAVENLGCGLIQSATHEDGTIEALEDPEHPFFVGVQWHPERSPESETSTKLFAAFVEACREYHQKKVRT